MQCMRLLAETTKFGDQLPQRPQSDEFECKLSHTAGTDHLLLWSRTVSYPLGAYSRPAHLSRVYHWQALSLCDSSPGSAKLPDGSAKSCQVSGLTVSSWGPLCCCRALADVCLCQSRSAGVFCWQRWLCQDGQALYWHLQHMQLQVLSVRTPSR